MKKKLMITMAVLLTAANSLCACGAFSGGDSAALQDNRKEASYSSSPAAAYDYDMEEAYETEYATDEAYYMDDEAIARSGAFSAPASGSGKPEAGSGNDGDAVQTSGGDGKDGDDVPTESDSGDTPAGPDDTGTKKTRKLITTVSIEAETEQLESILQRLESEVTAFGGYIESSYISKDRTYAGNDTYVNRRRATMTLRVPEAKLETVLSTLTGETNVLEESRTTEDITLTYVDIESRKKSLETQRESLLRLLEQAETVEDIITIEDRLSYVNYEIERMGGQLRSYDNLVDYATIHLTLQEVVEYTPVQKEPETVLSRIAKGFSYNLKRVGSFFVDFFVWVVSSLPQLVVIAVVIVIAVKLLGWLKTRRAVLREAHAAKHPDTAPKAKKGLRGLFAKKKQNTVQTDDAPAEEAALDEKTTLH